jgi:spore maturation protein CgeB
LLRNKTGGIVKVFLCSYHNPNFVTITEYIARAILKLGHTLVTFDDRKFILPGRLRRRIRSLQSWDASRINKKLISLASQHKSELCIITGGYRILPETIISLRAKGVVTALWTIDAPLEFGPIIKTAPHYDFVFTGGSEAYDILKDVGVMNLHWLPFACDPEFHRPQTLKENETKRYGCDIVFAGTVNPELYPRRFELLEAISDFDLGVWGPGYEKIPLSSPLKQKIRGSHTTPEVWTKIYSQAKIVLCIHYNDPTGVIPCHQASPRVYEALACGSFLLVDAQKDVLELFKDGEDLVVFRDSTELRDLVSDYLQKPEERHRIARNGRKKALAGHTYQDRISKLFEIVFQA